MKIKFYIIFIGLSLIFLTACESEYSKTVKSEIKSGKEYKELFLDMNMGMTQKEFYAHCWSLNERQLISQGSGNKYAKHIMELKNDNDSLTKVIVLFYGIFDKQSVMYGMDMKMEYSAWSPWNKDYHAPALADRIQNYYMDLYGMNPFIEIDLDNHKAYAKIDGNRQILIFPTNNKSISVKITDITKRYNIDS